MPSLTSIWSSSSTACENRSTTSRRAERGWFGEALPAEPGARSMAPTATRPATPARPRHKRRLLLPDSCMPHHSARSMKHFWYGCHVIEIENGHITGHKPITMRQLEAWCS